MVAIGIDRYRHWRRLDNAVADALGAGALLRRLGFEDVVPPLLDERATGKAIDALVTDELTGLRASDSLIVFFAGHGGARTQRTGGRDVRTGYLIPTDGAESGGVHSWIELDAWLRRISRLPPRHILVILDACFSGIALSSVIKWGRGSGALIGLPFAAANTKPSRLVITSALDDERAMDSGPMPGHSLFTGCLLEGLTGGVRPVGVRDGRHVIIGSELGHYVRHRVQTYDGRPGWQQTPDVGTFDYDERGEMLIPVLLGDQRLAPAAVDLARGSTEVIGSPPPDAATLADVEASAIDSMAIEAAAIEAAALAAMATIPSAAPAPSIADTMPEIAAPVRPVAEVDPRNAASASAGAADVDRRIAWSGSSVEPTDPQIAPSASQTADTEPQVAARDASDASRERAPETVARHARPRASRPSRGVLWRRLAIGSCVAVAAGALAWTFVRVLDDEHSRVATTAPQADEIEPEQPVPAPARPAANPTTADDLERGSAVAPPGAPSPPAPIDTEATGRGSADAPPPAVAAPAGPPAGRGASGAPPSSKPPDAARANPGSPPTWAPVPIAPAIAKPDGGPAAPAPSATSKVATNRVPPKPVAAMPLRDASAPGAAAATAGGTCTTAVAMPKGGEVIWNGTATRIPCKLDLPCGVEVELLFRKPHFVDSPLLWTATTEHRSIPGHLTKVMVSVDIGSMPPGATIVVSRHSPGITPYHVQLPEYESSTVTLTKDGYAPLTRKITPVKDGDQIYIMLTPLPR
jgi:hypothetical protein